MFFVISKILSFLYSPLFWVFLFLLLTLIYFKNKKKSKLFLIITIVLFFIFSNSFIADEMMRLWEMQITRTEDLNDSYDAGILLGGGMVTLDTKTNRLIFSHNCDRFFQTIQLYKQKRIKKIIITGGSGNLTYHEMAEAPLLRRYLISIKVPEKDILIDSLSDNTRQNAAYTKEIINKTFSKEDKFLLITSAIHMKRALGCFRKAGINVSPFTTNKHAGERRYELNHLLLPEPSSFVSWEQFIHEYFGYLIYGIMGYL